MERIATRIDDGKAVKIDLQKILEGRMLIQANSGGGKSYAIRKFCEITHGKVQQIIIDVEGEFASLREQFDYLLISKNGDIPINLRSAELLARRLLELNVSAIIDLYELKHNERIRFVKVFLDSMINAPKDLWHNVEIILDEGHIFAPEKGMGEAESAEAVKDMATRGRKRGFALVIATQRLSKLDKNVAAELNTKLIGRSSLDVDMKRAAFELGFTSKDDIYSLRTLAKGEFYAFGSAISDQVIKVKIDKVVTTHAEAASKYIQKPIPPTEKIKQALVKLTDLPQEAEQELKTKEDLQKRVIELIREVNALRKEQPQQIDKELLDKERKLSYSKGYEEAEKYWKTEFDRLSVLHNKLLTTSDDILKQRTDLSRIIQQTHTFTTEFITKIKDLSRTYPNIKEIQINNFQFTLREKVRPIPQTLITSKPIIIQNKEPKIEVSLPDGIKLRDGAMRMLKAVAMYHPNPVSKNQVATLASFSVGGGSFNTYLSELKRIGWIIQQGDLLTITETGLKYAGNIEPLSTDSEVILNMWCSKFRAGCANMLRIIASAYPNEISKEELGEKAGFAIGGGSFNTYLSELRRNSLIEISGNMIKATKELFPMELA